MPDPIRSHWRNGEWDLARASAENLLHEAGFRQRDGAWEGPARPDAAGWLTLLARVDVRLGRPKSALAAAQAARVAAPDAGWETAVAEGEAVPLREERVLLPEEDEALAGVGVFADGVTEARLSLAHGARG